MRACFVSCARPALDICTFVVSHSSSPCVSLPSPPVIKLLPLSLCALPHQAFLAVATRGPTTASTSPTSPSAHVRDCVLSVSAQCLGLSHVFALAAVGTAHACYHPCAHALDTLEVYVASPSRPRHPIHERLLLVHRLRGEATGAGVRSARGLCSQELSAYALVLMCSPVMIAFEIRKCFCDCLVRS